MGYKDEMEGVVHDLCKYVLVHWRMLILGCSTGALIAGFAVFFGGVEAIAETAGSFCRYWFE